MALEDLAGYSLRRGLGSGSVGTVWLLRDLASGRHAVLKRVPKTSIPSIEAFTEDVALARSIDHPHVARLLDVRESEGEWLLISQYVAAGTLAALLERRGPLTLGELVTLISPLAQGLAAMHRAGLVHGHLGLRDVMFDADGRPVITDAGLRLQEYPGSSAADLASLGNIARHAGGPPTVFPESLFTGDGDQVSRRILQLAPPTPIHLGQTTTLTQTPEADEPTHEIAPDQATAAGPAGDVAEVEVTKHTSTHSASTNRTANDHGSTHRSPASRASTSRLGRRSTPTRKAERATPGKRSTRRRITPSRERSTGERRWAYGLLAIGGVAAVTVLVIGLATVGVLGEPAAGSVATNNPPTPPRPTAASAPPGVEQEKEAWLRTLHGLDVLRARAFSTLNQADLDQIYVPGSAPWTSDRTLLASYRQQQIRVDGLRVQIESLEIERPGNSTVVLRIVDRLVAGTAITSTGHQTPLPQGLPTTRRLTLKSTNTTWRISTITTP